MKKIILFLLLSVATYGQVSSGMEQEFDYGIKNNAATTVLVPNYVTTQGADGTYGKIEPINLPVNSATQDSLNKKLNISDLPTNLTLYPTTTASDVGGYVVMVKDIHDVRYNTTAVDVSTAAITTTNQLVSQRISDAGVLIGEPGVFNVTTFGNIRRLSGSGTATFFFRVYQRTSAGVETLIGESSNSGIVSSSIYLEFTASAIWDDGLFLPTDRIVIKSYANRIVGGSDPIYQFQFGGLTPVRTILPVPFSVVDAGYEINTNKQNSLAVDGTGIKYPTVDAVNKSFTKIDASNIDYTALGDSITYGYGSTSGTTSYVDIINSRVGFKSVTKLAQSGITVMPTAGRGQLYEQVVLIPAGSELITVMAGVNDYDLDNPLGDLKAVMSKTYASLNRTLSFAEAFRYNLESIKLNNNTSKIYVILPTQTNWVGLIDIQKYLDIEIAIANYLSIPVIDVNTGSGIWKGSTVYIPDGLHPNDLGYNLLAEYILSAFNSPKQERYRDFLQYLATDNTYVDDTLQIGSNNGSGAFKVSGFKGISHGKIELFPYANNTVPNVKIHANGQGTGSGFSYFDATDGRYGFGTKVDNGVDKLQVNGSGIFSGALNVNNFKVTNSVYTTSIKSSDVFYLNSSYSGGTVVRFTMDTGSGLADVFNFKGNGTLLINTTTDNGTDKLQVNGSTKTTALTLSTSPTTSASTYDILTRNSSTGVVEKKLDAGFAHTSGNETINGIKTFTSTILANTLGSTGDLLTLATGGTSLIIDDINSTVTATVDIVGTNFIRSGSIANQVLKADGSVSVGYKVYTALLSQSGTTAPTATVLENTLGGTVVWTRTAAGSYTATLTGAFVLNKTSFFSGSSSVTGLIAGGRGSNDTVLIATGTPIASDGLMSGATIEIRVYN